MLNRCNTCRYKLNCIKQIGCINDYGEIFNKKDLDFCSNYVSEKIKPITFQSNFSLYITLKNLYKKYEIIELARVLVDDDEIFILSIDETNVAKKNLIETLNKIFLNKKYRFIHPSQFDNEIEQYLIIEKIKF